MGKALGLLAFALLLVGIQAATGYNSSFLWPRPTIYSYDTAGANLTISPCQVNYIIQAADKVYIQEIISIYLIDVFKCTQSQPGKTNLTISVSHGGQFVATNLSHEKYTLNLSTTQKWVLKADYYVGFIRGFETFSQLFRPQTNGNYVVSGIPISVTDQPQYLWRGLMIDTARHYLSVDTIKHAIDGMVYLKLNVLHWHIVDEDAFPMYVPTVPELSDYGSVGGVFSENDLKTVIAYAKLRGIRVVPQVDTPAHTQSWGRSQKYKNMTLDCNGIYMGQFDPTIPQTWDVVKKVFTYVNNTFEDQYVHFGGDQVVYDCWGQRQSIKDYMNANNIPDFYSLSVDYRQRQKKMFREEISPKKKVIYWANEEIDLPLQDEDVIHWWGTSLNQDKLSGRKNQVILSNYNQVYLDVGFNNFYGNNYGVYQNWRAMYKYEPRIPNANVIGGESCMWNQLGTKHTFDQKVFQRASIVAERLWNTNIDLNSELNNIATRLQAQAERLRSRGFKVWPVTVELCEKDMSICF